MTLCLLEFFGFRGEIPSAQSFSRDPNVYRKYAKGTEGLIFNLFAKLIKIQSLRSLLVEHYMTS